MLNVFGFLNVVAAALKSCIKGSEKKNEKIEKIKFIKEILCNILVRTLVFFSENVDPENMKKLLSKVAHIRPQTFFFCTGPAVQTAQKQKSRTPKSP